MSEKKNNVVRKNYYRVFPGAMPEKFCRNMIAKIDRYSIENDMKTIQRFNIMSDRETERLQKRIQPFIDTQMRRLNLPVESLSNQATITKRKSAIRWHIDKFVSPGIPYKFFIQLSPAGSTLIYDRVKKEVIEVHLSTGDIFMFSMDLLHGGGPSAGDYKYLLGFRLHIIGADYTKENHKHDKVLAEPMKQELNGA